MSDPSAGPRRAGRDRRAHPRRGRHGHGHLALDDELDAAAAEYFKGDAATAADARRDRRVLPRAADGRRGLHRRRRARHRAAALSRTRRSPRRPPSTPTCSSRSARIDPHRGAGGRPRRPAGWSRSTACAASSSTRASRRSTPTTARRTRCTRRSQELGVPALFHTGQTGIGAGRARAAAGSGCKYSNPMLLDDVAADFPDLTIIMAHPSFPWQDEALAVATHKAERLHRPVRLVAEVLPAAAGAVRQHAAQGQGAVRLRLPAAHARPLARRLRRSSTIKRRGAAADPQGERRPRCSGLTEACKETPCATRASAPGRRAGCARLPRPHGDLVRGDDRPHLRASCTSGSAAPAARAARARRRAAATGSPTSAPTTRLPGDAVRRRQARRDLRAAQRPARRARSWRTCSPTPARRCSCTPPGTPRTAAAAGAEVPPACA